MEIFLGISLYTIKTHIGTKQDCNTSRNDLPSSSNVICVIEPLFISAVNTVPQREIVNRACQKLILWNSTSNNYFMCYLRHQVLFEASLNSAMCTFSPRVMRFFCNCMLNDSSCYPVYEYRNLINHNNSFSLYSNTMYQMPQKTHLWITQHINFIFNYTVY